MPSHLNLFLVLAGALKKRGHRVVFFGLSDNESQIRACGFDFYSTDPGAAPPGTFSQLKRDIGKRGAVAALRAQGRFDELRYDAILNKGPDLVQRAALDGIVVDQAEACSGSVAEVTRLPWVDVASALSMNIEPAVPLMFTTWSYSNHPLAVLRNRLIYRILDVAAVRTRRIVNRYRTRWGLHPLARTGDSFSPFAQLSQQNAEFDFPRKQLPACFHYVGPIRPATQPAPPFPWHSLNGQPLIYASLGTVNQHRRIFETIAQSCVGLRAQLVLSLGGAAKAGEFRDLPGAPLVVEFAPQLQLLERAALTITHGGLNTTLESLAAGVPLIAIPLNFDQFGVAARIRWTRTGDFMKRRNLTPARLRSRIEDVLSNATYKSAALRMRDAIAQTNGAERSADIIESVIRTRRPVLRHSP
ncbi:MAG: MGT family glycosyltransferase [Acidobacteriaceae bacterium]|nr:MGT family glycosyltransferase [Acidobacteriaceae bacterium]